MLRCMRASTPALQALMIVIGNPAVLMHNKHWLALLLTAQAHGACVGQPMPDLSEAAAATDEAARAGAQHGHGHTAGTPAGGGSSSSNGYAASTRDPVSGGLQQQIVQLERLMASIQLSRAVDDAAAQHLLLQETLGFSAVVDEVGGGMVRRD